MMKVGRNFAALRARVMGCLLACAVSFHAAAATYAWINTNGGSWSTAANWTPNGIPGASDNASITLNGNYSVSVSGASISNLNFGGSSGTQTLNIQGSFTMNGTSLGNAHTALSMNLGTLSGAGTFLVAGPLLFNGGSISLARFQTAGGLIYYGDLTGGVWANTGTLMIESLGGTSPFEISSGAVLSNTASGTVVFTNNYPINTSGYTNGITGAGLFYNSGDVLVETPYTDQVIIQSQVNNAGTFVISNNPTTDYQGAVLIWDGSGTNSGKIEIATNNTFATASGTYVFTTNSTVSNPGTFAIEAGNISLEGTVNCGIFTSLGLPVLDNYAGSAATTVTGSINASSNIIGEISFTNGGSLSGPTAIEANSVFNGTGSISPIYLYLIGGTVSGTNTVNVSGTLDWTGGTIAGKVVCNGGLISDGYILGNTFQHSCYLTGGELINVGVMKVQNTTIVPNEAQFVIGGGGVYSNAPGSLLQFVGFIAGTVQGSGGGTLCNGGTVFWTNSPVNIPPNNGLPAQMTINSLVNTGYFALQGDPAVSMNLTLAGGATNESYIVMPTNSALILSGGTFDFPQGSQLLNQGSFTWSGTVGNFGGIFQAAGPFTINSGTINLSGVCNITNALYLNNGTLNLTGNSPVTPISAAISGGVEEGTQTLSVTGSGGFLWSGGTIYGNVQFNGGATTNGLNLYGSLANSGTFAFGAPLYLYGGTLTNHGTVNLTPNISLQTEIATSGFYNDGQVNFSGPGNFSIATPFNNAGTLNVYGGTMLISSGGTEDGTFNAAPGATLQIGSGTFNFNSDSTITGAGNLYVNTGTANMGGLWSITGTNTFAGGQANVTGACNITNALVMNGGTLNLNGTGTMSPATASLNGATEEGSQVLQVTGAGGFSWTGGWVYGTILFNGGSGASSLNLGGFLVNTGTASLSGYVFMYGGSLTNKGTLNLASGFYTANEGGTPIIENDGQLTVAGPGTTFMGVPFNNYNAVTINGGILQLSAGGTETGSFSIASGATLNSAAGTVNFNSGSAITGFGTNLVYGATANFNGTASAYAILTVTAGNANFNGTSGLSNSAINLTGGTLALNGSGAFVTPTAAFTGGTLVGTQILHVTNSGGFTWSGGVIGNGSGQGGKVQCNGGAVSGSSYIEISGGTLINTGVLNWTEPSLYEGQGSVISNAAGATINIGCNLSPADIGEPRVFYNAGQITSSSSGLAVISAALTNTGTIAVNSGVLALQGAGSSSGPMTIASGATLTLSGNPFSVSSGSTISGAGNFAVSNGSVTISGALNATGSWTFGGGSANLAGTSSVNGYTVNVAGGTVDFSGTGPWQPGTMNISAGIAESATAVQVQGSGSFTWTGGQIGNGAGVGQGAIIAMNGGAVSGSQVIFLSGGVLMNSGVLNWMNPTLYEGDGAVISNATGGTLNLSCNFNPANTGDPRAFYNAGQLTATPPGTAIIPDFFTNTGAVTVGSGTLELTGSGNETGAFNIASGSTLQVSGSPITFNSGSTISGAGNFEIANGTINFSNSATLGSPVLLQGGLLNLTGSSPLTPAAVTMTGGTIEGSQTLEVSASPGFIWLGGSIGNGSGTGGVVQCNGGVIGGSGALFIDGGQLINTGLLNWTNAIVYDGSCVLSNASTGTINILVNLDDANTGGTRIFCNAGQLNMAGKGTATIDELFTNTGTVNLTSGVLTLAGPYSLTNGALNFTIASLTSFGKLNLPGNADLAGTVALTLNGYTPLIGDTFDLISYGSESGAFGSFTTPSSANWAEDYGATAFSVQVSSFAAPTNVTLVAAQNSLGTNGFTIQVSGPTGYNYLVQVSTNLAGTNWVALTNFMSTTTLTSVTDSAATSEFAGRFYRASIH